MNDNASQSPPHHDSNPNPNPTTDVKPDDNHSPTVHASGPPVSESQARVSRNGNPDDVAVASSDVFRVRVSSDGDDGSTSNTSTIDRRFPGSDSKSLFSEFDDYVAADRSSSGVQRDLGYGFEIGDMVWGKVKSHPWWPGHIYNEAFATSSVRRTKREGHVLVAFFGDSSYGWFEPAELIPFDANFAEKSQQLHSRTFLKAVEEAVDEASRRRGLGLTCKCRNSDNFRAADVKGYFSVDVLDYEPGGFYSDGQIRKARDSFVPSETLDFVRELALAPHDGEHGSIGFVKNKATVSAYRKAVFEQYDETYAQAFGVQPSRPSRPQNLPHNQPARQPPRAPLSGPMVIAEALGGGKSATKSAKVKDSSKKDRYLFKRRDDPSNSLQLENKEETPDAAGHYVFQKRAPPVPVMPHNSEKHTDTGFVSHDGVTSTSDVKEGLIGQVQADSSSLTSQAISLDAKPHLDKGKESSEEMTRSIKQDNTLSENMGGSNLSGESALQRSVDELSKPSHLESNISMNVKHDWNVKLSEPCDEPSSTADGGNDLHQIKTKNNLNNPPIEAKHHKISAVKNIKGHKRPANDLNSNTSVTEERKKKKKKNPNLQPMSDPQEKHRTAGKFSGNLKAKPLSTTSAPKEDFPTEKLPVDVDARNLLPMDTSEDVNFELPQLLGDLQALALNPFHGIERKIPAAVLLFFLRFRSLVYQKSLVLSPPTENEAPEVRVIKSPLGVRVSDNPEDHIKALPIIKPVKHVRLDDPTKAGRKRAPSDRQEEIAAKRVKKIKDIKTLAAEKAAASQKTSDARREDAKEPVSQAPSKFAKPESAKEPVSQAPSRLGRPDSAKRVDRSAKVVEPTTLVIKFPPGTSLPSVAELKARFARFGQMDQSGFRVFWKSSTCRVVFLFKADAQAAYKFCVANQSLFGSVGVRCFLRESGDSAPEVSEATKVRGDDGSNETPRVKDPAVSSHKPLSQPAIQLKSILKKSTGDESGQVTGNGNSSSSSKGNPRVKFVLGGEESSSKGEQLMVGNKNLNNASFADGGAMDFNSKNVQKVASQPPLLPTPPLATQFTKSQQHNLRNSELAMAPRNIPNFINTTTTTTTVSVATVPSVDISQQMISLLTRCNDVVTNLTGLLGYVPYHPL